MKWVPVALSCVAALQRIYMDRGEAGGPRGYVLVVSGEGPNPLIQSHRRKLFNGLVAPLALELSTLATLKLLNSLKVFKSVQTPP